MAQICESAGLLHAIVDFDNARLPRTDLAQPPFLGAGRRVGRRIAINEHQAGGRRIGEHHVACRHAAGIGDFDSIRDDRPDAHLRRSRGPQRQLGGCPSFYHGAGSQHEPPGAAANRGRAYDLDVDLVAAGSGLLLKDLDAGLTLLVGSHFSGRGAVRRKACIRATRNFITHEVAAQRRTVALPAQRRGKGVPRANRIDGRRRKAPLRINPINGRGLLAAIPGRDSGCKGCHVRQSFGRRTDRDPGLSGTHFKIIKRRRRSPIELGRAWTWR